MIKCKIKKTYFYITDYFDSFIPQKHAYVGKNVTFNNYPALMYTIVEVYDKAV